jgi:hypothetical protein
MSSGHRVHLPGYIGEPLLGHTQPGALHARRYDVSTVLIPFPIQRKGRPFRHLRPGVLRELDRGALTPLATAVETIPATKVIVLLSASATCYQPGVGVSGGTVAPLGTTGNDPLVGVSSWRGTFRLASPRPWRLWPCAGQPLTRSIFGSMPWRKFSVMRMLIS